MTVSSTTRKAGPFNGNGVTTSFPFAFKVFERSDPAVWLVDPNDNHSRLTLDVHYSVTLNADQDASPGGSITYPVSGSALANGYRLYALSAIPQTQTTDFANLGRFFPQTHEDAFDKLTALVQQMQEVQGRSLLVSATDAASPAALPEAADRAGKYFAFDAEGNPVMSSGTGADAGLRADLAASGGSLLVNDLGPYADEVAQSVNDKLLEIVSVTRFMTSVQRTDVRTFTYTQDVTTPIDKFLAAAEGRAGFMPKGGYYTGRLLPRSNTTLHIGGGSTIRKKPGGTQCMKVADKQNVHIHANGAIFDGQTHPDGGSGDTINISDSQNCSLIQAHILGAGALGQDCIYIGSDGNDEPCEDILIKGGSCANAQRNGISVVAGKRVVIDGVEIYGTTYAPGAGIDVEANVHGMIQDVEIKHCKIRNNIAWGVVVIFGDGVNIHHNTIYDNGNAGVSVSGSGTQFNAGVARSHIDIRAFSAVDIATGKVTLSGFADLEVGTIITPRVRNGAVLPTGLAVGSLYFVYQKNSDGTVILSSTGVAGITSFAGAGSGTLTTDPTTSDWYFLCYEEGQASNVEINNNTLYNNNQVRGQIDVITAVKVSAKENNVQGKLDQSCMSFTYSRHVHAERNQVKGVVTGTSATARGIHFGICTRASSLGNTVKGCPAAGLSLGNIMRPGTFADDEITNCGMVGTYMVRLEAMNKGKLSRTRCRLDSGYTTTFGIGVASTVTNTFVSEADCEGVGSNNANSILLTGSGNKKINCIQNDGTLVNT